MSIEDKATFTRLEMQVADLKGDLSKIADTVAVVPNLVQDVDALKRQTAQIFEQQMKHAEMLVRHAEMHTQHTEALMAQREETRHARQSASDLSAEFKDAIGAMTRYVDTTQRATSGDIASLSKHVEALAKNQALVASETSTQTKTLANLNTLITTLTKTVTKNPHYLKIGVAVGGAIGTAIAAAVIAIWKALP